MSISATGNYTRKLVISSAVKQAFLATKSRRTWTTRQPDASRSATSPRSASASWKACVRRDTSLRGNDQFRMVTGPAQHPQNPSGSSTNRSQAAADSSSRGQDQFMMVTGPAQHSENRQKL